MTKLETIKIALVEKYGQKVAQHRIDMVEFNASTSYKKGGAAWTRYVISRLQDETSLNQKVTFIAPSPETVAWGGCLGGEWVPVPNITNA